MKDSFLQAKFNIYLIYNEDMINIKLTDGERMILANQELILSFLDKEHEEFHLKLTEIYRCWYSTEYLRYSQLSDVECTKESCEETLDILSMFSWIQFMVESMTEEEKKWLDIWMLEYGWFDANTDGCHYWFARFLIDNWDYPVLKECERNSHSSSTLPLYKRLLKTRNEVSVDNSLSKRDKLEKLIESTL